MHTARLKATLALVMLATALTVKAQTRGDAVAEMRLTAATSSTIVDAWQSGDLLSSLIRTGFTNHLPLGIVLEGNSLCKKGVPGSNGSISIASLIDQLQGQDADYAAELVSHVLYVHPKAMKASTLDTLELRIPSFTSEPTSAQEVGISLWMYIRGVLVPQESSAFSGGVQGNAEMLPAIHLANSSVHDILDRVITLGQGGVWILYQVPSGWQSDPKTIPYEILSYSGEQRSAEAVKCLEENEGASPFGKR